MCGIFAICNPATCGKEQWFNLAKAHELSRRQRHRGPDFHGSYQCPLTGNILCHERLAIMDLHCTQPIEGRLPAHQVVHNGEIYNHAQLHRDEFSQRKFLTSCDSEVIIHLYDKYRGDLAKVCSLLDGVFSFALCYEGEFMAARDPIGVKQLYYGRDAEGRWFFASEMKTMEDRCGTVELDSFPPGHYFTLKTGFVAYYQPSWFHWEPTLNAGGKHGQPDLSALHNALVTATHKRLMSDASIGALLSGGLDSSLVCAIAAKEYRKNYGTVNGGGSDGHPRLMTFSIGLDASAPDVIAARKLAAYLDTEHHEFHFSVEEGLKNLEKLVWHLESYDVTTIRASTPMYFLSEKIAQMGVKVVLSGEGADEVFGGYLYFHNAPSDEEFQRECIRRVSILSKFDCLRADKSCYAHALEARFPFLDKGFLEVAMNLPPEWKRPRKESRDGITTRPIEKWVLRKAFDTEEALLPPEILWRQKEQFSDGVGYGWIDQLVEHCAQQVTDEEFKHAAKKYPYNTPATKEAYYIREVFHRHFPSEAAAQTVERWIPKWQTNQDPSGRANAAHVVTLCDESSVQQPATANGTSAEAKSKVAVANGTMVNGSQWG